jgi:hypothetical protein
MFSQPEYPEAVLDNGQIRARVYLPDALKGFYRSTRFDWSGGMPSLEFQGHRFYGPWFTKTDPPVHDFIYEDDDVVVGAQSAMVGPVEEFPTPQGYAEAKPGQTFVKIGVGVLRKADDSSYSPYANYEFVDPGAWKVQTTATSVETCQEVNDEASGIGYAYQKTLRLAGGAPELVIEHRLTNTGRRAIDTRQYNHNFLVLDKVSTGPDFTIAAPFEITSPTPPDATLAEIRGGRIVFTGGFAGQDRVSFDVTGFGADPKDYDFRLESARIGVGVRVRGDRPLASVWLWSIRSVISIEPFIDVSTAPGATTSWTYTYTYYGVK